MSGGNRDVEHREDHHCHGGGKLHAVAPHEIHLRQGEADGHDDPPAQGGDPQEHTEASNGHHPDGGAGVGAVVLAIGVCEVHGGEGPRGVCSVVGSMGKGFQGSHKHQHVLEEGVGVPLVRGHVLLHVHGISAACGLGQLVSHLAIHSGKARPLPVGNAGKGLVILRLLLLGRHRGLHISRTDGLAVSLYGSRLLRYGSGRSGFWVDNRGQPLLDPGGHEEEVDGCGEDP
mmetsp:Transcript_31793/g.90303  ORF Transcript_31793/g.90303 Transcript_31793/m.90303 type:complete len:230 (-) Transcript_31793:1084-1773(-)